MDGPFELGGLGWLQFQWLCEWSLRLLSGVRDASWRGGADQVRIGVVEAGLDGSWFGMQSAGARAVVAICWVPGEEPHQQRLLLSDAVGRLFEERALAQGEVAGVLMTNVTIDEDQRGWPDSQPIAVVDASTLNAALEKHESLRLRAPSVLGLRPLSQSLETAPVHASSLDLDAAEELTRVFVPTRAYQLAVDVLERHRFAVLTGPPEMGKTAIARMIGLARLSAGWQVHECLSPDDFVAAHDAGSRQVFIADDAFGSTEYRPDAAERWARELPRILDATDERHWLIWTSRPAPLRAGLHRVHQERGTERFPSPAQVQIDAAQLDIDEKACILLRHAKAANLDRQVKLALRSAATELVRHPHFTPERIRRFVASRLAGTTHVTGAALRRAVHVEMQEPTQAMAASLAALSDEHKALLVAMLDCPDGPVPDRELVHSMRRHHPQGLSRPPAQLVDRLSDHFLRVMP